MSTTLLVRHDNTKTFGILLTLPILGPKTCLCGYQLPETWTVYGAGDDRVREDWKIDKEGDFYSLCGEITLRTGR